METKKTVKDISFKCATLTTERTCKLVNELLIKGFTLESPDPEHLIIVSNGKINHNNSTEWFANHPAKDYTFEQAMKLVSEIEEQKCKLEIKYSDERNRFYVDTIIPDSMNNYRLPTPDKIRSFLEQEYTKIMFENGTLKNKLSYLNEPEPTKLKRVSNFFITNHLMVNVKQNVLTGTMLVLQVMRVMYVLTRLIVI